MKDSTTVLVTGGTGFLGMRIILELLKNNYNVRATVRDIKNSDKIKDTLINNKINNVERLSFVQTELTADGNWAEAMHGCKYVLSVASPVFFDQPKDEESAFRPAREGILRILKFAKIAGVGRVVMTSNFGAVGFTQTDKTRQTTEMDWTDATNKSVSVYERSKTLAEKAGWDFVNKEGGVEFSTINPVAILGPSLDSHISGSFHLIEGLLKGTMKAIPNIPLNIVDVRDVAKMHIRAMEVPEAAGQRFIATSDGQISLWEIAELIRKNRPELSSKITTKKIPDIVLKISSLFNKKAKEGVLLMNMNRNVSNEKARKILGLEPSYTKEEAILAAVDSMKEFELI